LHDDHTDSATSATGFDNEGVANGVGLGAEIVIREIASRARDDRHAELLYRVARAILVAHEVDVIGAGPDERETVRGAGSGKCGVFRKQTVTGMDGIAAGVCCRVDYGGNVEIRLGHWARPEQRCTVRGPNMHRTRIRI
jgi:hypothetical protein